MPTWWRNTPDWRVICALTASHRRTPNAALASRASIGCRDPTPDPRLLVAVLLPLPEKGGFSLPSPAALPGRKGGSWGFRVASGWGVAESLLVGGSFDSREAGEGPVILLLSILPSSCLLSLAVLPSLSPPRSLALVVSGCGNPALDDLIPASIHAEQDNQSMAIRTNYP